MGFIIFMIIVSAGFVVGLKFGWKEGVVASLLATGFAWGGSTFDESSMPATFFILPTALGIAAAIAGDKIQSLG